MDNKTERQNPDDTADATPTAPADVADKAVSAEASGLRWLPRARLLLLILVLLLLISGVLTGWLYFSQYRPDKQTDGGAAAAAVSAARDGTIAMLSYAPDTLDQNFATAKSHLTGDFLEYYDQFTQQIVTPAAKQKSLATTAQVMGAAVTDLHSNSAIVLVFVNQSTTSKDKPDPSMSASSVQVSLTKVGGRWLITKFDPV